MNSPLTSRFPRRSRASRLVLPLLTAAVVLGGTEAQAQWLAAPANNVFGNTANWMGGTINGTFSQPSSITIISVANNQFNPGSNITFSGASTPTYTLGLTSNAGYFQLGSGAGVTLSLGVTANQIVNSGLAGPGGASANKANNMTASATGGVLLTINGDFDNVNNAGSTVAGLSNYLILNGLGGTGVYNGIISNGKDASGAAVAGNVILKRSGNNSSTTWTINGVNTYTGGTEFGGGATGNTIINSNSALSTGAFRVINGQMNIAASAALTGGNAIANTINYVSNTTTPATATFGGATGGPTAGSNQVTITTAGTGVPQVGDLISGNLLGYFPNYTRVIATSTGTGGVGTVLTLSNNAALTTTTAQTGNSAAFNSGGGGTNIISGSSNIEFSGTQNLTTTNSNLTAATQTFQIDNTGTTTFSGVLQQQGGVASIAKTGAGTLILSGNNTFTGGTTLTAGTMQVGNNNALGTGNLILGGNATLGASTSGISLSASNNVVLSGGNLTLAGANPLTINGIITNSGANRTLDNQITTGTTTLAGNIYLAESNVIRTFTIGSAATTSPGTTLISGVILNNPNGSNPDNFVVGGGGMVILTGANTYTGTTGVTSGSLLVNNITGSGTGTGAVSVSGNGTLLGGTGTISGTVAVGTGSIISAGAGQAVGKLTTGALTLTSGVFNAIVTSGGTAGTAYSQLVPISFTSDAASTFSLTLTTNAAFSGGEILTLSSVAPSTQFSNMTFSAGGYTFTADYAHDMGAFDVDVSLVAVPEPATWFGGLILVGVAGCSLRRRFRGQLLTA